MRIVVLLSAGRHPVSFHPCPVPVELQAIRLARELAGSDEIIGLHAGPELGALKDVLGHGLSRLIHLRGDDADPLPTLAQALSEIAPDVILAGRVGQGGEETGLLPYALARALGRPILNDASGLERGPAAGTLAVEQALPRGVRRRIVLRLPAVITVHPAARPAVPFTFAEARRGVIEVREVTGSAVERQSEIEERSYRKRPKLIAKAAAGASAAERLKAATQAASAGGKLLVNPTPDEAAREILSHLRSIGVLRS